MKVLNFYRYFTLPLRHILEANIVIYTSRDLFDNFSHFAHSDYSVLIGF